MALPKIVLISTGGTIASSAEPGAGATVQLTGADLLAGLPQAAQFAELETCGLTMVPSGDLRLADVLAARSLIREAISAGAAGVVLTQGTDTLEETAYVLDLLTGWDEPVVLTGAMRPASLPGTDGPANLLAAIRVAASPAARGLGALVVLNDEIHAARHVRKRHTSSTATFGSPVSGPVGSVTEDRVRIAHRLPGRLQVRLPDAPPDVRVALVTVSFDDDGRLLGGVPSLGYHGLVVAAFGGGHVPRWIVPVLAEVSARIPVVFASRTCAGELLRHTYGYPGSESDLISGGLIPAVSLDPAHAVVLLRLLLMAGVPRNQLAWCFEQASDPEGIVVVPSGSPAAS
jgi:L-asparaginase